MTDKQKQQFIDMACELSPENLCCDGELSRAQTNARYRKIMKRWHALEATVGRSVSESEAWDWTMEESRKKVVDGT